MPSQIQAQLTWNGVAQGWITFGTSGHNPGDVYYLPLQVTSPLAASGIYAWSVEVKATVGGTVYDRTASGVLPVVVNSSSPFGAGWALGGIPSLLLGTGGVAFVDTSTGGARYFTGTGPNYTSPANDQGTLCVCLGACRSLQCSGCCGAMFSLLWPKELGKVVASLHGRASCCSEGGKSAMQRHGPAGQLPPHPTATLGNEKISGNECDSHINHRRNRHRCDSGV